jgi:hypothetical protein
VKLATLALAVPLLLLGCADDGGDAADDGGGQARDLDGGDGGGDRGPTTAPEGGGAGEGGEGDAEVGFVVVHLEPTDAIFIEGFEVGLRFDDPDTGEELKRAVWSELMGPGADPYAFFVEQPLRPGPVRLGVDVNIGIGPGPEPPDLDADRLPCELDLEVVAGETVEVEVGFDDSTADCARLVS